MVDAFLSSTRKGQLGNPYPRTVLRGFCRVQIRNSNIFRRLELFPACICSLSQWLPIAGRWPVLGVPGAPTLREP